MLVADTPQLRGVNETAARVWELIDGQRPVSSICEAIAGEFDAPREQIDRDVVGFLEQLLSWGWVEAG
ncbi:MAG: PqqD family protein [Myxococcaceae bacterium]